MVSVIPKRRTDPQRFRHDAAANADQIAFLGVCVPFEGFASAAHPANPALKLLSNPIKVDGQRPHSPVCASLGADNDKFLPARTLATADR